MQLLQIVLVPRLVLWILFLQGTSEVTVCVSLTHTIEAEQRLNRSTHLLGEEFVAASRRAYIIHFEYNLPALTATAAQQEDSIT